MSTWRSPTKQRRKQRLNCDRKKHYQTQQDAASQMREMQELGKAAPDCRVYECTVCGFYLWGHVPGRRGGVGSGNSHVKERS